MKNHSNRVGIPIILLLSLMAAVTAACGSDRAPKPQGIREYRLAGRVESVDFDKQRVTIAHDKIDGYMDAMTMPFPVRDASVLRDLKSGDRIEARLMVDHDRNMSWLEEVESKK